MTDYNLFIDFKSETADCLLRMLTGCDDSRDDAAFTVSTAKSDVRVHIFYFVIIHAEKNLQSHFLYFKLKVN